MIYTEKEVETVYEMTLEGKTFEQIKNNFLIYNRNKSIDVLRKLHLMVRDYFNLETIKPKSQAIEEIAPMVIFAYLCHELIKFSREQDLYLEYIKITGRSRCSYLNYEKLHSEGLHLLDIRVYKGDTIAGHFKKLLKRF